MKFLITNSLNKINCEKKRFSSKQTYGLTIRFRNKIHIYQLKNKYFELDVETQGHELGHIIDMSKHSIKNLENFSEKLEKENRRRIDFSRSPQDYINLLNRVGLESVDFFEAENIWQDSKIPEKSYSFGGGK